MQAATECDIKYSSSCPETLNCSCGGIHNDCQGYEVCFVILTHWQLLRKYCLPLSLLRICFTVPYYLYAKQFHFILLDLDERVEDLEEDAQTGTCDIAEKVENLETNYAGQKICFQIR